MKSLQVLLCSVLVLVLLASCSEDVGTVSNLVADETESSDAEPEADAVHPLTHAPDDEEDDSDFVSQDRGTGLGYSEDDVDAFDALVSGGAVDPDKNIASEDVENIIQGVTPEKKNKFDEEFREAFLNQGKGSAVKTKMRLNNREKISPFTEVKPVADDKFALLLDSIFSQKMFNYRSTTPIRMIDTKNRWYAGGDLIGKPWPEWVQNRGLVIGNVKQVTLRFEHPEEQAYDGGNANSFYVELTLQERGLDIDFKTVNGSFRIMNLEPWISYEFTARHSLALRKEQIGGLKVEATEKKQHRFFLPGRNGSGMVVIVPATGKHSPRGALICPRDYEIRRLKAGYRAMDYTGYEMVGAQFRMLGKAYVLLRTGFGPGYAASRIQVTPSIIPSQQYFDESTTMFPESTVNYVPEEGTEIPAAKSKGTITAGFKIAGITINSFKHKVESIHEQALTVKRLEIRTPFSLAHRGIQFRIKPGPCYAVIKEDRGRHIFSKEPLPHMPEDDGQLPNTPEELDAYLLGRETTTVPDSSF